jgi:SAM-dependent methyltransferase
MNGQKHICRNCGSAELYIIKNGAVVAPFFASRVWGLHSLKPNRKSRSLRFINFIFFGLSEYITQRTRMCMNASLCDSCDFYSTEVEIPEQSLSGLYRDYRSDTYNSDRELYEPGYSKTIGKLIGGTEEAVERNRALSKYLKDLEIKTEFKEKKIKKALDWGGADGRFLPNFDLSCERYIFEISNISSVEGVTQIAKLSDEMRFDYIQLAHVLEHMSNPLRFINEVVNYLNPRGYLYLEVPLEVNPHTFVEEIKSEKMLLEVHEHINKYTENSLKNLVRSAKLEVIDVSTNLVDMPWTKANVIRLLAKK